MAALKQTAESRTEVDALTGLPPYGAFVRRVGELGRRGAKGKVASLALFDLDGFGRINEQAGHDEGDAIIRRLAETVLETAGAGAEVFRYGGDAISVLLPGMEKEDAFLLIEACRRAFDAASVEAQNGWRAESPAATVSVAVAAWPEDGGRPEALERKLQAALYRAKVTGPGKVCLAREEKMVTKTSHYTQGQLEGLTRLAKRLEKNEAVLLREGLDDLLRKYNA